MLLDNYVIYQVTYKIRQYNLIVKVEAAQHVYFTTSLKQSINSICDSIDIYLYYCWLLLYIFICIIGF